MTKKLWSDSLPDEWHCPHCNYGEYKNRDDWQKRATDHIAWCQSATRSPEFFGAEKKERCNHRGDEIRCIRREGHDGPCKFPEPSCTCEVAYEFAPHPCAVHGVVKDEKPERKRFKIPKPAPMSDLLPASDYIIAQRMAKIQEKLYELKEAYKDHPDSMVLSQAIKEQHAKRDAVFAERDQQQAEYDQWIAAGRPRLDKV